MTRASEALLILVAGCVIAWISIAFGLLGGLAFLFLVCLLYLAGFVQGRDVGRVEPRGTRGTLNVERRSPK